MEEQGARETQLGQSQELRTGKVMGRGPERSLNVSIGLCLYIHHTAPGGKDCCNP